jgi:negative regulator of sigma E activity
MTPRRSWRKPALALAAAVGLVLLVIAGIRFLSGDDSAGAAKNPVAVPAPPLATAPQPVPPQVAAPEAQKDGQKPGLIPTEKPVKTKAVKESSVAGSVVGAPKRKTPKAQPKRRIFEEL